MYRLGNSKVIVRARQKSKARGIATPALAVSTTINHPFINYPCIYSAKGLSRIQAATCYGRKHSYNTTLLLGLYANEVLYSMFMRHPLDITKVRLNTSDIIELTLLTQSV